MDNAIRTMTNNRWQHFLTNNKTIAGLIVLVAQMALNPGIALADDEQSKNALQSAANSQVQLETFDAVWNQVKTQYFDYERIEADWLDARETYRPQAENATTTELRRLLNIMLEMVGESHFLVLPPTDVSDPDDDQAGSGDEQDEADQERLATGLGVRLIDSALIVDRVGPANAGVIDTGWELLAVDDQSLTELVNKTLAIEDAKARARAQLILEATTNGLIGFPVAGDDLTLSIRTPEGEVKSVIANTDPEPVEMVRIGNLPGLAFSYRAEIQPLDDGCIGVVTFTTWVPELMDRFLESREELFACEGLIIDLRGNLGGVLSTMIPLTSHLVNETVLLGQLKREDARLDFRSFPRTVAADGQRIQPYAGPIAILIDSMSASTSEMFTAGMQALGRARVFGTQSPGMALPAQILPLANGDRLMYAFADYIDGQGRRIEGIGVPPDQAVEPTRAMLAAGDDPVLLAATRWMETKPVPENSE